MCDSNKVSSYDQCRLHPSLIHTDTSGYNTSDEHFESLSTRSIECSNSPVIHTINDNFCPELEINRRKRKASFMSTTCSMAQTLSMSCSRVESPTLVSAQHLSMLNKMMDLERTNRFMSNDHRALREADPSFHKEVWRERVAQWCYDALDYLEDSRDVAAVAMNIIDRYLAVLYEESDLSKPLVIGEFDYEVISFTALFLAIRVSGSNNELEISELLQLSSNSRVPEARHIVSAGNSMLQKLSWNNQILTPNSFLRELVAVLVTEHDREQDSYMSSENLSSSVEFASYLVELSVCDSYFSAVAPSKIAFGALALAMICGHSDLLSNGHQYNGFLSHFFQIIQEHTSMMLESLEMNSILSRLLHVYNQSQEAVADNVGKKSISWGRIANNDTYQTTLPHIIVDEKEESHVSDQKIYLIRESDQDADHHSNDQSVNTNKHRPVSPLTTGFRLGSRYTKHICISKKT